MTGPRPLVVFLCVQNAGRSQMAAAWLTQLAGDRVLVQSGGSDPARTVHPLVIEVMDEIGLDLSAAAPQRWTDEMLRAASVVVTMGCGDSCPVYAGVRYEDWDVDDPSGKDLRTVRRIRDDIGQRIRKLLADLDRNPVAGEEEA